VHFKKVFTYFLFSIFFCFSIQIFSEIPGNNEEIFFIDNGKPIIVSIETYKNRENYTPVTLRFLGLDLRYWLDEAGNVKTSPRSRESAKSIKIDMNNGEMELNNHIYPLVVIAENSVRSVFRVGTRSIPMEMRLDKKTQQGRILLGDRLLPFMNFRTETKSLDSGFQELQLKGSNILPSCSTLVIDPKDGALYKVANPKKIRKFELMQKWGQRKGHKTHKEVTHEK